MYDIVIIGGGTAGLTAALYAQRAGKKTIVLEGKAYGGQILYAGTVENFPGIKQISGSQFIENLVGQVKSFGGEMKLEKVTEVREVEDCKIVRTDMDNKYKAKAIIIATGEDYRKLNAPGENEYNGRGVSYCATCDGELYRNKIVAVIGGGNSAIGNALYLSNLAEKVYLVHRREEYRAEAHLLNKAKAKNNIEFLCNQEILAVEGGEKVEKIKVKNIESNEEYEIDVEGVFVSVGYEPQNQIFSGLVELDMNGYIKTEDGVHTSRKGIYVAGDARAKELRQLVTAASDGAITASTAVHEI